MLLFRSWYNSKTPDPGPADGYCKPISLDSNNLIPGWIKRKTGILEENMGATKDKSRNRAASQEKLKSGKVKRRRNKGKSIRFLVILFALIYLPALWKWVFHGKVETDILYTDALEIKIRSEGVFIRDETAVRSPKGGIVIPKVNQGERVPNDYGFVVIVDKDSQAILKEIENLEKNIIRQYAENNPDILSQDENFRNNVQNEVNKLTDVAVNKNFSAIEDIKATLETLLYQRNRQIFENSGDRLYLEDKKRELELLRDKLNESAVTIKAQFSGIVVWGTGSVEEKYSHDNINNLKIEDLQMFEKAQVKKTAVGYEQSFDVAKDQEFARLVSNETSWYVCVINKKDGNNLKAGDKISLKIDGIKELIPCTVESTEIFEDGCKVVVSFNRYIEKTVHLRHVKADLVIESVEGLKIPQRSLTNRNIFDNTADVYLVRFNRAVKKRVKIIAEQDSFAIIDKLPDSTDTSPVRIFDIYVVNPQNIEEGQVID